MIALLVGGWMAIHGQATVGTIVAFVSGFERMAQPLRELTAFYRVAAQSSVQLKMINSWIEAQPER